MALWSVKLDDWTAGTFRQIVPEEILVEFEHPLTFTFRDEAGTLLLAHLLSRDDMILRYILAPTSQKLIEQLRTGRLSIFSALDQPLIWLVDVDSDGHCQNAWAGSSDEVPSRVLPAPDVMLYPELEPMLRLRAIGETIGGGSLPASALTSLVGGAEKAVRLLVRHIAGKTSPGRPPSWLRDLYQLEAQQFAFHSFEVALRPAAARDQLLALPERNSILDEVERLLAAGLQWLPSGELPVDTKEDRRAVLDAIKELSPTEGSFIARVEVSGRVAPQPHPYRPVLTKQVRRIAGEAVKDLQGKQTLPSFATRVGHVGAVDVDNFLVTVRNTDGEDSFKFEEEFLDDVLDALNTQQPVSTVAASFSDGLWLMSILSIEDRLVGERYDSGHPQ